jgi:hypothetical protein
LSTAATTNNGDASTLRSSLRTTPVAAMTEFFLLSSPRHELPLLLKNQIEFLDGGGLGSTHAAPGLLQSEHGDIYEN